MVPAVNRITMIVLSAQCLLLLSACKTAQPAKGPAAMPIVPVSVARATQESVPTELRVVGTVEASAIVQIKSQISGQLRRVSFTEGQNVAQGDLLFEIDPRPYEEALRRSAARASIMLATLEHAISSRRPIITTGSAITNGRSWLRVGTSLPPAFSTTRRPFWVWPSSPARRAAALS